MQGDLFPVPAPVDPHHEAVKRAPYQKSSATSKAGADAVQGKLSRQCAQLLDLYVCEGPLSDWDCHLILGWERTTVTARRHGLGEQVKKMGKRVNPDSGILNDVYGAAK